VPRWIPTATYVFVSLATAVLLTLHTFKVPGVQVDTTTLGLLAMLLLVPIAPYIRRVKAAGIEAEIGPHEVQHLQAVAAELPAAAPELSGASATDAPTIQELVVRDPPLGLAKLRIELEREVRQLYVRRIPTARQSTSLGVMARELRQADAIPPDIAVPLADVTRLANRAVHGEYVPGEIAQDIAAVGLRVLSALRLMNEGEDEGERGRDG
jgi:hypothetical protein